MFWAAEATVPAQHLQTRILEISCKSCIHLQQWVKKWLHLYAGVSEEVLVIHHNLSSFHFHQEGGHVLYLHGTLHTVPQLEELRRSYPLPSYQHSASARNIRSNQWQDDGYPCLWARYSKLEMRSLRHPVRTQLLWHDCSFRLAFPVGSLRGAGWSSAHQEC